MQLRPGAACCTAAPLPLSDSKLDPLPQLPLPTCLPFPEQAVTRSTPFAAGQPEEKALRVGSGSASSDADEEMVESSDAAVAADAAAALADEEQQRELEEHLRARQEREEAYERALEQRRQELAALQAAAEAATAGGVASVAAAVAGLPAVAAGTAGGEEDEEQSELQSVGSGTSESKQPGTPDHGEDLGATGTASATPAVEGMAAGGPAAGSGSDGSGSSPEPEAALAQAAGVPLAPAAAAAASTSLLSSGLSALAAQQAQRAPLQPQAQQGLLSGTFAGLGPLGLLQQQQQQAAAAAAALDISRPPSGAAHGLLGTTSGSLFGSPAMAAGLAGLPGTAASLGGSVDGSLSSSLAGSPFPGASLGAGSPSAARPLSAAAGLTSMSPPGSLAPFPSPSSAPARPPGLPPLPGSRSASFGASLAGGVGQPAAAAAAAAAAAVSAADSDQMLSMRLQDALFVGSPAMASPGPSAHARRAASPQAISGHRHPLFAGLARDGGQLSAGGEADDDADSIHLLSSSLSCLDDDAGDGRGLVARTMSGNGSLHGGFLAGGEARQRQEAAAAAAAESLMAGLRQQGLLSRDVSDPALLAQLSGAAATSLGSPGGGSEGSVGSAAQRGSKDLNSDEVSLNRSCRPRQRLCVSGLGYSRGALEGSCAAVPAW